MHEFAVHKQLESAVIDHFIRVIRIVDQDYLKYIEEQKPKDKPKPTPGRTPTRQRSKQFSR